MRFHEYIIENGLGTSKEMTDREIRLCLEDKIMSRYLDKQTLALLESAQQTIEMLRELLEAIQKDKKIDLEV